MSRAAADAVALTADGVDQCAVLIHRTLGLKAKFVPHRLRGLAARCLASSNAVYDKINYCDGGSHAYPLDTHSYNPYIPCVRSISGLISGGFNGLHRHRFL